MDEGGEKWNKVRIERGKTSQNTSHIHTYMNTNVYTETSIYYSPIISTVGSRHTSSENSVTFLLPLSGLE